MSKIPSKNLFIFILASFTLLNANDNISSNSTNAQGLYGTKFNGNIRYRYDKELNGENKDYDFSDFDLSISSSTKLNENFNFKTKFLIESDFYHKGIGESYSDLDIENLYINAKNENAQLDFGRVTIDGPLSDEPYANGVKTTAFAAKDIEFYANLFLRNSIEGNKEYKIAQFGSVGKFSKSFSYEFWAAQMNENKFYNASLDIKMGPAKLTSMHSWASYENTSNLIDSPSLTKFIFDLKYGYINSIISFGSTTREGNYITLDKSTDAKANYSLWQLDLKDKADSYAFGVDLRFIVYPKVTLRAAMGRGVVQNFKEADEYLGEISYKYSKKLTAYIRGSKYTQSDDILIGINTIPTKVYTNYYKSRFEIKYTF